ncbi:TPA: hypothetical protein PET91_002802 [Staphylococcus aureus]|nr:hypothetical protein [Staphylococcus aureus]
MNKEKMKTLLLGGIGISLSIVGMIYCFVSSYDYVTKGALSFTEFFVMCLLILGVFVCVGVMILFGTFIYAVFKTHSDKRVKGNKTQNYK